MPDSLEGIADREVEWLSEELRKAVPADMPVTILLYQPIPRDTPAFLAGRFVDIGPRPVGALSSPVYQGASSGASGDFLSSTRYSVKYLPTSKEIGDSEERSYALESEKLRRAQVQLERLRYPELRWKTEDLPPVGSYIHHLSISPAVYDLHDIRTPSLGVVYTITGSSNIDDPNVQGLIHVSQVVAKLALENRIRMLLGQQRMSFLSNSSGDPFQLIAAFVFAHHWFYPHSPEAALALRHITGSEVETAEIYRMHGWEPPPFPCEGRDLIIEDCIKTLTGDLLRLGHYNFGRIPSRLNRGYLEKCVATVLLTLSNRTALLEFENRWREDGWLRLMTSDPVDEVFACVLPEISDFPQTGMWLPVYGIEELRRSLYTAPKSQEAIKTRTLCFECAGPGNPRPFTGRRVYIKPKHFITGVDTGACFPRFASTPVEEGSGLSPWLKAHSRFLIEQSLRKGAVG